MHFSRGAYESDEFISFTSSMYPAVYSRAGYWVYNLCVLETVSEADRAPGYRSYEAIGRDFKTELEGEN